MGAGCEGGTLYLYIPSSRNLHKVTVCAVGMYTAPAMPAIASSDGECILTVTEIPSFPWQTQPMMTSLLTPNCSELLGNPFTA